MGPYNRGYLAAIRFFAVAGKHDSRDIKINLKNNFWIAAFISRLSCTPVTPVILTDLGTRQLQYKTF